MSLKQKINIFEKIYDIRLILLISVEIFHDFGWFFATRVRFRIRFTKRIRIRLAKMKRIQTDPKHWFLQYKTYIIIAWQASFNKRYFVNPRGRVNIFTELPKAADSQNYKSRMHSKPKQGGGKVNSLIKKKAYILTCFIIFCVYC